MLPGCCKNGIVISKIPVMQAGLKEVMRTHFPEYEIISSASAEDLTLLQLRRSGLVIADLAGESEDPRSVCEHYYSLISQYREIHWVFMVSRSWYSQAVELLMCPTATLLSDVEPIENLVICTWKMFQIRTTRKMAPNKPALIKIASGSTEN